MHSIFEARQAIEDYEILAGHALDAVESYGRPGADQKLNTAKTFLNELLERLAMQAIRLSEGLD
ncbi:MAG: hypothetical protein IPP57_04155 [Candidatus Obscuribacter sp.]|jgi:hypothetical protein|nr:hypothetical protein [Candidatus Obscuribacter sp.]MBK9618687.1 hypothetical protein [Candidatus Obscuribacter sp.]MBK9770014.1 hypothetical protein [Candidatus Obscuribacter sp.]